MSRRPPSPNSSSSGGGGSRSRPTNFSSANSYSTLRYDDNNNTGSGNNGSNGSGPPPSRPERSVRRPLLATPSPASMDGSDNMFNNNERDDGNNNNNNNNNNNGNHQGAGGGSDGTTSNSTTIITPAPPSIPVLGAMRMDGTRRPDKSSSEDSASKSKRMMDRLNLSRQPSNSMLKPSSANNISSNSNSPTSSTFNDANNGSPSLSNVIPGLSRGKSHSRRSSTSSTSSIQSSRRASSPQPHSNHHQQQSRGEITTAAPSAAVTSALAAFSNAGARRRELGSTSSEPQNKKSKTKRTAIPKPAYPDTPAFREVDGVLRKITREFPMMMIGTSGAVLDDVDDDEEEEEGGGGKAFDPVSLALSLLDSNSSSNGSTLSTFLRLKSELDHSISSTLSSNASAYRAFESSISGYNSTVAGLSKSQEQVAELKKNLGEVRGKLDAKGREGLAGMYNRMSHLEEMGKILDEIDSLRSIPDRLETLLSEKRFLTAVVLVVRSLKIINRPEMLEIGALGDLRAWLKLQEGVLLEILIEELHNHLYLKSFYCDARWKSYTPGQTDLPIIDFGDDFDINNQSGSSLLIDPTDPPEQQKRPEKLERYLNDLSLRPSYNPLIDEPTDDPTADANVSITDISNGGGGIDFMPDLENGSNTGRSRNPEGDSYNYIESLLESLACLGKLGFGLDAISQRVQIEMFNLVESTVDEVGQRNDSSKARIFGSTTSFSLPPTATILPHHQQRGSLASLSSLSLSHAAANRSKLLRLTATETAQLELSVETLRDVFWTLYSKLLAVLMGFRVAYDVAARISERREFKDSSLIKSSTGTLMFSLLEAWKPVQQEVRALLHDYLTDDQSGALSSRNPIVSVNEVLRLPKPRDHAKQIFKFADSDVKASLKALRFHEEELNRALKIAVPGLMTEPTISTQLVVSSIITDDRYGGGGRSGPGGTHKSLVQADAFNVSVLFGPTFSFLEKVKEIMPSGLLSDDIGTGSAGTEGTRTAFGGFLNDFVLRTFLPQLEEKVTLVFKQAVGGHDAFLDDPNYKKLSQLPIVKAVSNIMLLISSLSGMLKATPFHRENYAHLIVRVIQQFFTKCQERFQDLTARESIAGSSTQTMSATWSEISEVKSCLVELREVQPKENARLAQALRRETKIELESKGNAPITQDDLILPSKKLLALGTLYTSLDWFILQLSSVQITSDAETPAANGVASEEIAESSELGHASADMPSTFSIPLTQEMTEPLEQLIESYKALSFSVLFTLRLEVRIRTIHYLDKATRDGVYQLSEDIAEPDPSVVDLNSNLAECDECAAMTLAPSERKFMFEGLSSLMDQLLISNSRHIRLANRFGLSKMMRNILALQQNLKNIGDSPSEVDFDRSRKFWEVFAKGPKPMLEAIRTGALNYEFEDYKSLLNLMCGIDQSAKDDPAALSESSSGRNPSSTSGTAGNSGVGADRGRRLYNEFLIELFALDVDG